MATNQLTKTGERPAVAHGFADRLLAPYKVY